MNSLSIWVYQSIRYYNDGSYWGNQQGTGRAFCAGGDLRMFYKHGREGAMSGAIFSRNFNKDIFIYLL